MQHPSPARPLAPPIAAAIVAVVAYCRAPWNGLAVDDTILAAHPLLQSAHTLPAAMASPWWYPTQHLWRPLATATIGGALLLAHGAPWLVHLVNVLLHALACALVTRLAQRWFSELPALAAGLLFALVPAHAEGVATVVATAELIAATGLVAVMLAATRAGAPSARARVGIALLAALALAGKEGGVAAPVLAAGAAWAFPPARRHAWRWGLAAFAGTAVMLAARLVVLGQLGGDIPHALFRTLSFGTRVGIALALLPRTAVMLFFPVRPAINYSPPLAMVLHPPVAMLAAGALLVLVALVALVAHLRRPTPATLGLLVISATLAPTSNLLFGSGVVLSGRSTYSPGIGAALLVAALVSHLRATRLRPLVPVVAAGWLAWCAALTWREVVVWRSSGSALAAAATRDPDSYWVPMGQAYFARDHGRPAEAIAHFRDAAALFPRDWEMLTDAATVALAEHDTADAERWLRAAVGAHPGATRARVRLEAILRARQPN